jgi:CRISPR-associated endonuclease Cas2
LLGSIKNKASAIRGKWDGKYRLVIFDIPEKKNKIRAWLRQELYSLNFSQLQKSVFIGKYPLPDEIIREVKKAGISDCVNYLLVDKIFDDKRIKK